MDCRKYRNEGFILNCRDARLIVLVANNPLGHHLLASQLLDHYQMMMLKPTIILLCNGVMPEGDLALPNGTQVVDFSCRLGPVISAVNLLRKLVIIRVRYPSAVYHLRGFFAGLIFCISRLCFLKSSRYIYDPRGAFFIEWREAKKPRIISRIFFWFEALLTKRAEVTIVTSRRFERLYSRLFAEGVRYLKIYNSTSFSLAEDKRAVPTDGPIRLTYMGTFNEWHCMDELFRVMSEAARQLGPSRTEIHIFTPIRFHQAVCSVFSSINCRRLKVDYVSHKNVPKRLAQMHLGVSIVRPTLSTSIASPIKIADYIALGLLPVLNTGVGDFDPHFAANKSGILFSFGGEVDFSNLTAFSTAPNTTVFDKVCQSAALEGLRPAVERLLEA